VMSCDVCAIALHENAAVANTNKSEIDLAIIPFSTTLIIFKS
jgi:hypothetical protein